MAGVVPENPELIHRLQFRLMIYSVIQSLRFLRHAKSSHRNAVMNVTVHFLRLVG
jgi:hypothetical protein